MKTYLDRGEYIITKTDDIGLKEKPNSLQMKNTLLVTNRNLIIINRTLFGRESVEKIPLHHISSRGGQLQIFKHEQFGIYLIYVYLIDGSQRVFNFTYLNKDHMDWIIDNINLILNGETLYGDGSEPVHKSEYRKLFEEMTGMFRSKKTPELPKEKLFGRKMIVMRCTDCGESLSGVKGQLVQCPRCGNYNVIE